MEALACGVPVIAYDLPVYKRIYKGILIVVPIGDKNTFAKKIVELLKDERKRIELSEKAKKFVRKYSWENIALRVLECLNEQMNKRGSKS